MQVRDKLDKLKRHSSKDYKLYNVTGNNVGSQWIWFNMIDKVLSDTTKTDRVHGSIDNSGHVRVDNQPPSQPEKYH